MLPVFNLNDLTSTSRIRTLSHAALCKKLGRGRLKAIMTAARSALTQGPDVPTTVLTPNSGQEQVEPGGGELRIRQLPESVWQVAPMTGARGS